MAKATQQQTPVSTDDLKLERVSLEQLQLYKNPRKDLKDIKGLAASIVAAHGVTQPLKGFFRDGVFLVVDGQRRFTSLNLLKEMGEHAELLVNIPFLVMPDNMTEAQILAHQIISNEGEPLSPLELAEAIVEMLEGEPKMSIVEVAESLGKSKVYIGELKRLAEVPEYIKALIRKGTLSATLVREQIKAQTLDAFIANINENGVEGDVIPSEDVSGEIEEAGKQKITNRDLNKLNSLKVFKKFSKTFSEIFPNEHKQATYEFVTGLVNNEYTHDQIVDYFTDAKTRNIKAAATNSNAKAAGSSDTGAKEAPEASPTQKGGEARKGLKNAPKPKAATNGKKLGGDKKLTPGKKVAVEPKKAPQAKKAATVKAAAPKKAAPAKKAAAAKNEPSKKTIRKIGYDRKAGKAAE